MAGKQTDTTEQEPQGNRRAEHPIAVPVEECHRCGAAIPEGETRCPDCGRRLYRVCYCGWRIAVTALHCPECGADWSGTRRARKRAHSHRLRPARLGAHAVGGALGALVALAMLWVIVKDLALRALPQGQNLPGGLSPRLALAWTAISDLVSEFGHRVTQMGEGLSLLLLVLVLGAATGALVYLLREDLLRVPWPPWGRAKGRHYRRRRAR